MSQQNLNKIYGQVAIVEEVAADVTLDKYDTGKVFYVDASSDPVDITLPGASSDLTGWTAKFIIKDGGNFPNIITISGTVLAGSEVGTVWDFGTNDVDTAGGGTAVTGDTCEIVCTDGATATFVASCTSQN